MTQRQGLGAMGILLAMFIGGFVAIAVLVLPALDASAKTAILGALAGAVGGVAGSGITSLVSLWATSRDNENKLKDRASNDALELTRMDYDLRQKSLALTGSKRKLLAPVKVYRELYKALLQLHDTGDFLGTINELGLLQVIDLGTDKHQGDAAV